MFKIYREFTFDAAHYMPNYPDGHKYRQIHGHSFRAKIWLSGKPDPEHKMICDFANVDSALSDIEEKLDHVELNALPGLEKPTLEGVAEWMWNELQSKLPQLHSIEVHRGMNGEGCIYQPN